MVGLARIAASKEALPAWFDAAYIGLGTLFIIATRLPILELSRDLQPDEAQYGANALMAASGWLNWDTLDSGSSGPLQSMVQAWPLLLGCDITFTTIHITGAVLASLMIACVYLTLRRALGPIYGVMFTLPTTIFLGGTTYFDLVHSTSLYLPITLSLFGTFVTVSVWRRRSLRLALTGAFALGLIPLVKLHGVILAGYVGIAIATAYTRAEKSWSTKAIKALPIIVAAAVPIGISIGSLLIKGRFGDFVLEGLSYSTSYIPHNRPSRLYWIRAILGIPDLFVTVALFSFAILLFGWIIFQRWRNLHIFTWFSLGLLAVAYLSILVPGKGHHLYLLFIVPILPFPAAALAKEARSRRANAAWWLGTRGAGLAAAAITIMLAPTAQWSAVYSPALSADGAFIANGLRFRSPHLLQFLIPTVDNRLIVFGYQPGIYIDAGMPSGTRETWSENVIETRPSLETYRRRFVAEMDISHPAMFIDTVNEGNFGWRNNDEYGPHSIPELARRLERDYRIVSLQSDSPSCSRVYLRQDYAATLPSRLAKIASVRASDYLVDASGSYRPENVIDRHVFETCVDRWLGAQGTAAWLDLELRLPQRISRVSLLNTRGTWRSLPEDHRWNYTFFFHNVSTYHAARSAVVALMNAEDVISEKKVEVSGYPYWTDVDFDSTAKTPITHVRIRFPDWYGVGPGLNEIAVIPLEK